MDGVHLDLADGLWEKGNIFTIENK